MSAAPDESLADAFVEPRSIKEAEIRLVEAGARVLRIQAQLSEGEQPPRGTPEYVERLRWRQKARIALSYAQVEASRLRIWIKYQRQELAARGLPTPDDGDPDVDDLLEGCYRALKAVMRHHDYLPTPDQQIILNAARAYLQARARLHGA